MKRIFLPIVFILFFISQSFAQIATDRPDQTEGATAVGKGVFQIEAGTLLSFTESNDVSFRQIVAPNTLFRYGLLDWIELRLVSNFEMWEAADKNWKGISNLEIGTKIWIAGGPDAKTQMAILSHLSVPSGSGEVRSDNYGTINRLSVSHSLTDKLGLGYNLGYSYFGEGSGNLLYTCALGIGVNSKTTIYIEPYGTWVDFDQWEASFDTGFTYLVNPNFQLDFSLGTGLNYRMNYLALGFSWRALGGK